MATDLWAVHVEGPDVIIAAESFEDADKHAREINDWYANRRDKSEHDPVIRALVRRWPYRPDGHARELADPNRWRSI